MSPLIAIYIDVSKTDRVNAISIERTMLFTVLNFVGQVGVGQWTGLLSSNILLGRSI